MRRIFGGIVLAALAGCSSGGGKASDQAADIAAVKAIVARPRADVAQDISRTEYPLYRSLMAFSGLDDALGGSARGDAALRGIMEQYRRSMLGAQADMPRLIKAADNGEVNGFMGIGASWFAGSLVTSALISVGGTSSEPSGSIDGGTKDGSMTGSYNEKQVSTSSTFKGEMDGMDARITTKVTLDTCPAADGGITIDFLSDSSMTKAGATAGANVKVTGKVTWYVNDNAEFGNQYEAELRIESASFGGARGGNGSFIDYSENVSIRDVSSASGKLNRASSKATQADFDSAKGALRVARLLIMAAAHQSREAFQNGRCVKLEPTSDPSRRSGVKPSTSFALLAAPRSKIDGTSTGGTVKADLSGQGKLDPAGSKQPADAHFTYIAPAEANQKGTVSFEARSKRGAAKADLSFDTNNLAYLADGGSGAYYHGTGKICNLSEPFTISGSGATNKFVPSGPNGGSYSYSGVIAGFAVWGAGTYKVNATESGGKLVATGPGSVKTPMGVRTANGSEVYTLTPTTPCSTP